MNTGPCILVVDDNRSIVRTLELVLQRQGYRVVTAYDGYEALEKAGREKPDVILLDVVMPGIDGYEVCRQLLARPDTKNTRVVFLTSKGRVDLPESPDLIRAMQQNVEERAEGFDAGAIGFISKPVSAKGVIDELHRILAIG